MPWHMLEDCTKLSLLPNEKPSRLLAAFGTMQLRRPVLVRMPSANDKVQAAAEAFDFSFSESGE